MGRPVLLEERRPFFCAWNLTPAKRFVPERRAGVKLRMLVRAALIPFFLSAFSSPLPQTRTLTVPLSASAEVVEAVGLSGDADAKGLVRLAVDPDHRRICYDFKVTGLATPLMAHIHKGPIHENGPSVVTLFTGPGGHLHDCVTWTQKWVDQIAADPAGFYFNLYTTEYPEGALRGQLAS